MTTRDKRSVVCFGELLWDMLPHGRFLGGAPANVGYHLRQLGVRPWIVSAVGNDDLGREAVARVQAWEVETGGIAQRSDLPTGTVQAQLNADGEPSYRIATSVAWDAIEASAVTLDRVRVADGLVFGSLAQRSPANRATLTALLAALPPQALRVFDVNLRAPHDDLDVVRQLARAATLLKVNLAEAARLGRLGSEASPEQCARVVANETGCAAVCITVGAQGAGFLQGDRWYFEPARPVKVADTIGAGDAFLAGFLAEYLESRDADAALRRGCRLAEWVASQPGATPPPSSSTNM